MKVLSNKSVDFPKFGWGITAGSVRELPEDKKQAEAILAHPAIKPVDEKPKARAN